MLRLNADKLEAMRRCRRGHEHRRRSKDTIAPHDHASCPTASPASARSATCSKAAAPAAAITLPKDMVPGTLKVRLEVYPTSLADLVKGLDGLLREPGGCFEQTSTSNYPNTLILDYLNQTNQANPEAAARAKELLDRGYARLIVVRVPGHAAEDQAGLRVVRRGRPPHEALTAYGLLQFKDMARVHPVDPRADQADAGVPAVAPGRAGRLQAERPGAGHASAAPRSTSPTPTSSGRWSRATRTTPRSST